MPIPYENTGPVDSKVVPDLSTLKDKSVVITGGSSGIGAAYVKVFLAAGAYVTNGDLKPNEAEAGTPNYHFVKCDVRQWTDQVAVFKAAVEKSPHKSIDIVIANAGISEEDTLFKPDAPDSEPTPPSLRIIEINLVGVLYTSKLALHYFDKQQHHQQQQQQESPGENSFENDRCLILTASMAAYLDPPRSALYQVSKFGVRGLMCNLRRSDRLRVNVIAPFYVDTPLLGEEKSKALQQMLSANGLSFALTEDCASAALRIASDGSINGRALGIIPRQVHPSGYMDLDHDSPKEGSILSIFEATGSTRRPKA